MEFHDRHLDSIQALRGITSLFIVLEHIRFLSCGAFGVDIFFCISGFMIMFSTHKSTRHFLAKRLIRILPLYYCMTLGTYALLLLFPGMFAQSTAKPEFLLKSLLFIPFDIGGGTLQPLMRIGWTINCEIIFYLLFLVSLRISHKYRGLICSLLLVLLVAAAQLLHIDFAPLTFYGNPVMLEFILGIGAYYISRLLWKAHTAGRLPRICLPLSLSVSVLCFLGLIITKPLVNILGFGRPLLWGIPALLIVLCFFIIGLYLQMPAALKKLGDISFSLYLMHYYPVTFLDRMVFDFGSFSACALAGVAVSIAVSVTLAFLCHGLVDKGFCGWLRRKCLG